MSTVPVGLKSLSAPIYFDLYPNPAQNEAFVITDVSSKGSVMIFDISGRKIQELNLESLKAKIDISQLSNGIYSVGIKTDIGQFWKKLIVSR